MKLLLWLGLHPHASFHSRLSPINSWSSIIFCYFHDTWYPLEERLFGRKKTINIHPHSFHRRDLLILCFFSHAD